LRLDIGGERGGKFGLVEEEEAVVRRQDRRDWCAGRGLAISEETDSPASGANAVI
jgi:hypothetical protein